MYSSYEKFEDTKGVSRIRISKKNRQVFTTSGTYPWSFVTVHRYSITDNQVMVATVKFSKQ